MPLALKEQEESMKLGYMGTPEISAELLKGLLQNGYEISYVVSNPDRPRGRSGQPVPSSVSQVALGNDLKLWRPEKPGDILEELEAVPVDAVVVFAYGSILPEGFLKLGRVGIFNLHGSLLPQLRGASPIQSALLQGLKTTGWSFQFVSQKMDCGDVVSEQSLEIQPDETAGELAERMVPAGIQLVLRTLPELESLAKNARKQDESKATYCRKITPADSYLDWSRTATEIHNQIRGMNPRPVARTMLEGKMIKIYRSALLAGQRLEEAEQQLKGTEPLNAPRPAEEPAQEKQLMRRAPGELLSLRLDGKPSLCVITGEGKLLQILSLQPENKKQMDASSFLNGHRINPGDRFQNPAEI